MKAFVKKHYDDIENCQLFQSVRADFEKDILDMPVMRQGKADNNKWYRDFIDQLNRLKSWYEKMPDVKRDVEYMQKTGIPRCPVCKKDFERIDKYSWKPACGHCKGLILSIG